MATNFINSIVVLSAIASSLQNTIQITESTWNTLQTSFSCGSTIVTEFDSLLALSLASETHTPVFDSIISCGVIYIYCSDDLQTAQQWILNNYDPQKVSIRSGGHSFGGYNKANDSIMFDLSNMTDISIINSEIVSVQPGVTLQEWVNYLSDNEGIFDRSMPIGTCMGVAFGGLSHGGGVGLSMRQYGLVIDNLIGFEILLCDNTLLTVIEENFDGITAELTTSNTLSNNERNELLFAIRGSGGSNYGIITKLYFKTFDTTRKKLFFNLQYPVLDTPILISNALKAWRDLFKNDAPNGFTGYLNLRPALEQLPIINTTQYPTGHFIGIQGLYYAHDNDINNIQPGYDILNQFISKVGSNYDRKDSVISESLTFVEISQNILNHDRPPNVFPFFVGRYSTFWTQRMVNNYDGLTDDFIEKLAQQNYIDIIDAATKYVEQNVNELTMFGWVFEPLGGQVELGGESDGGTQCETNTGFTGRDYDYILLAHFGFISPVAIPLANKQRSFYEQTFFSQLSNQKYMNYIDDTVTGYDQLYFDECIFDELIRIKNIYNPQKCFDYRWSIPLSNPLDVNDEQSDESLDSDSDSNDEMISAQNEINSNLPADSTNPNNYRLIIDVNNFTLTNMWCIFGFIFFTTICLLYYVIKHDKMSETS